MAFILRLEGRKMPKKILEKFEQAEKGQIKIVVPAMVFAELAYLSQKKRIDTNLREAAEYLKKHPAITEAPLTISTVRQAFQIDDIPELHDRLIAATGKETSSPILTNDPDMCHSKHVSTIWKS